MCLAQNAWLEVDTLTIQHCLAEGWDSARDDRHSTHPTNCPVNEAHSLITPIDEDIYISVIEAKAGDTRNGQP